MNKKNLTKKLMSVAFIIIVISLAIPFAPVWVDSVFRVFLADFDPSACITCFGGVIIMGCILLPLAANEIMKLARDVFYVNGNKAAVKWLTSQIFTLKDLHPEK